MLKILQARLQQYVNRELPDVQAGFRKGRGTRDQIPTSAGSSKKQKSSRKTSISALLTMPKPLTVWFTINCGKFWKRWEYQTTWPASCEGQEATVRTGHGTTDWFQTGKGVMLEKTLESPLDCNDIQPVHYSMSSSNSCFLTCIQVSQEAGKMVWYSHLFQNFPQ